jgi:site-specific DNA recombinase
MVTAAAIYARISSDPEGDRLGVSRQVADCQALAARRGWTIADRYIDDDRSAYSGKLRPEYRRMLDDIEAHAVDAVVVYNLDRLHRQPKELEVFFEVCDAASLIDLASVEGEINLASHDGRFQARIMGAMARKSSDDQSRRIRRKHLELAQAGEPAGGGTRPYGYRPDRRTVDPDEAAVVREAAARVAAGGSLRSTATELNERGVPTVTGKPWSVQVLRRMLMSPRLSAQRAYGGEIIAQGHWQPILTQEQTAGLRAILSDPGRLTRRTVRRYLLAGGLLRCGRCKAVMVARPREDGSRRYLCPKGPGLPGCGGTYVLAQPVEDFVSEAVIHRLDTPELAAALAGKARDDVSTADLQTELDRDQAQIEELAATYGQRAISLGEYLAARKPIEQRLDVARRELSRKTQRLAVDRYVGDGSALRRAWPELPLTRQRAIIAGVLDHVAIGPGRRGRTAFDPARLSPVWRI